MLGGFLFNAIIGSLLCGLLLSVFDMDAKFTSSLNEMFPKKHFKGNSVYYMLFFVAGIVIGLINFFI